MQESGTMSLASGKLLIYPLGESLVPTIMIWEKERVGRRSSSRTAITHLPKADFVGQIDVQSCANKETLCRSEFASSQFQRMDGAYNACPHEYHGYHGIRDLSEVL
jgi:hypothetical protein